MAKQSGLLKKMEQNNVLKKKQRAERQATSTTGEGIGMR